MGRLADDETFVDPLGQDFFALVVVEVFDPIGELPVQVRPLIGRARYRAASPLFASL
jgi:hypothetical protein